MRTPNPIRRFVVIPIAKVVQPARTGREGASHRGAAGDVTGQLMKHKSLWSCVSARMDCALRDLRGSRARKEDHALFVVGTGEGGEPGWRREHFGAPSATGGRYSGPPFLSYHWLTDTDCSPEAPTG
jgi:hypothetical protein